MMAEKGESAARPSCLLRLVRLTVALLLVVFALFLVVMMSSHRFGVPREATDDLTTAGGLVWIAVCLILAVLVLFSRSRWLSSLSILLAIAFLGYIGYQWWQWDEPLAFTSCTEIMTTVWDRELGNPETAVTFPVYALKGGFRYTLHGRQQIESLEQSRDVAGLLSLIAAPIRFGIIEAAWYPHVCESLKAIGPGAAPFIGDELDTALDETISRAATGESDRIDFSNYMDVQNFRLVTLATALREVGGQDAAGAALQALLKGYKGKGVYWNIKLSHLEDVLWRAYLENSPPTQWFVDVFERQDAEYLAFYYKRCDVDRRPLTRAALAGLNASSEETRRRAYQFLEITLDEARIDDEYYSIPDVYDCQDVVRQDTLLALGDALESDSDQQRALATALLIQAGRKEALPILRTAAQSDDPATRTTAFYAATQIQNQNHSVLRDLSVAAIKALPVYDLDTGTISSLDQYTHNWLGEMGGADAMGADYANDPIGATFDLMFSPTGYDDVAILKDPDTGESLSINQAQDRALQSLDDLFGAD